MNTLEKHVAMLSLVDPYIRRKKRCVRVHYFLRIDHYNVRKAVNGSNGIVVRTK